MVTVPGFLLRRLYVKQSLRKTGAGFEFELRNRLGSGYAHGMQPLRVDGVEVPPERTRFVLEGIETIFSEISRQSTFTLAMNRTIIVRTEGFDLEPGTHKVEMGFDVPGLGTLQFYFTDVVEGD
jgi:hypothetical protein